MLGHHALYKHRIWWYDMFALFCQYCVNDYGTGHFMGSATVRCEQGGWVKKPLREGQEEVCPPGMFVHSFGKND